MVDWQPINTAPTDGRRVYVKRVHNGAIAEGWAVFGIAHEAAPMRSPIGADPLNRLSREDYAREAAADRAYADTPRWLNPDRMHSVPSPTHWAADRLPECRPIWDGNPVGCRFFGADPDGAYCGHPQSLAISMFGVGPNRMSTELKLCTHGDAGKHELWEPAK